MELGSREVCQETHESEFSYDGFRVIHIFSRHYFSPMLLSGLRDTMPKLDLWPNKSPEPTAVGAVSSAIAVHVASRRWLSFLR